MTSLFARTPLSDSSLGPFIFVQGGTGILFSKELLRKIGPELSNCLKQMYTEHEDIELGRCVKRISGIQCTLSWETTNVFYQNYDGTGTYQANIHEISERKRGLIPILR